ncbi:MAG: yrrB 5 [Bacteroidetes bacterium]|jgi:serine phosphatase RsbU (regulator of sigma subunit)|nr:yrrB 5 [Bacteroidota bacterium]
MKRLPVLTLFLFCTFISVSQTRIIDSVKLRLNTLSVDTERIKTGVVLAQMYLNTTEYKKADSIAEISLNLAMKSGFKSGIVSALNTRGTVKQYTNDLEGALADYTKALGIAIDINYRDGMASCYTNLGIINRTKGEPEKALDFYFKGLRINELMGNKKGIATSYGNIANIHFDKGDYEKSLEMSKKAATLREDINDRRGLVISYNTIGLIYEYMNKLDESLQWYFKGLKIAEDLKSKKGMSDLYNTIALNYNEQKKFDKAIEYAQKALQIRIEMGNKLLIADTYDIIGDIYLSQGKIPPAKEAFLKSVHLAEEMNSKPDILDSYLSIALCDSASGDFKSAFLNHRKHTRLKDEIFNTENQEKLNEMQTRYESDKKEQQIKLLNAEKDSQEAINVVDQKRKNAIIISVSVGLLLVIIVAIIILRSLSITRKQKYIIEQSHHQIEEQKHLIEEKQKEILDSIKYASRIQNALLTSESYLKKYISDFFILYKPKDIVAGDFYWSTYQQNRLYLVVADCTGHGVPGAFMSMLNVSILNEIISERKINSPEKILNEARTSIIKALNPEGSNEESKDGMDCILAEFDLDSFKLRYAAANNNLYIVRKGELTTYKADKMPVGKSPNDQQGFNLYEVNLEKGDSVFLMTDGYADQFGGAKGKKFKYKPLEEKFCDIAGLPMNEQKQELLSTFEDWKGKLEQVDDVCIIGIKI